MTPNAGWAGRVAGGRLRRVGLATVPPGWDVVGRCGEGPRGGPGVGERGGVGRGAGSDDPSPQRIAVTDGSRASQPSGLDLLPDLPLRDFVLGGPDDRSATGRRGGFTGLLAGLAGGVSSHPDKHAAGSSSRPTCSASCLSSVFRPGGRFWSSFSAP